MVLLAPGGALDRANSICTTNNPSDTAYIANASVAFEAALESTIVAIDLLEGFNGVMGFDSSELFTTKRIIAAWKHLLP